MSHFPMLSVSVLLAPILSNNLLSISKITKYLNYFVIFNSTYCVSKTIL